MATTEQEASPFERKTIRVFNGAPELSDYQEAMKITDDTGLEHGLNNWISIKRGIDIKESEIYQSSVVLGNEETGKAHIIMMKQEPPSEPQPNELLVQVAWHTHPSHVEEGYRTLPSTLEGPSDIMQSLDVAWRSKYKGMSMLNIITDFGLTMHVGTTFEEERLVDEWQVSDLKSKLQRKRGEQPDRPEFIRPIYAYVKDGDFEPIDYDDEDGINDFTEHLNTQGYALVRCTSKKEDDFREHFFVVASYETLQRFFNETGKSMRDVIMKEGITDLMDYLGEERQRFFGWEPSLMHAGISYHNRESVEVVTK